MNIGSLYNVFSQGRWIKQKVKLGVSEKGVEILSEYLPQSNISSHVFVELLGLNRYVSRGVTLMKLFKQLAQDEFNEYYTLRGGLIELLASERLKLDYPDANLKQYELQDFPGFNQFEHKKPFSGVVDIGMFFPDGRKMIAEIKSKDWKNYKWIAEKGKEPEEEIIQGEFLAELFEADKYVMVWGFISDDLANRLIHISKSIAEKNRFAVTKNGRQTYDFEKLREYLGVVYEDIKWHVKEYNVRHDVIREKMEYIKNLRDEYINKRIIPMEDFTEEEFMEIAEKILALE